jgi:hypothetical protein
MKTNIISCLVLRTKQIRFAIIGCIVAISLTIPSFGQQEKLMLDEVTFLINVLEHHPAITITRQSAGIFVL